MKKVSPVRRFAADFFELLGSMRFAISLLMFICVASLIGTVLAQNQPANTYIDQFGPYWFELFDHFSIWSVYNSPWFLVIMAFLVVSTTLCVLRNAPKMIRDMRAFKEHVRGGSLKAFPHRVELNSAGSPEHSREQAQGWLQSQGYAVKVRRDDDGSMMLAAKKGSANKLGYIFAHLAIVVICVGGLLDSELPVRLQVWLGGKEPITENMLISQVPDSGRMALGNPSFRANMLVPEGARTASAVINSGEGVLVQPLPFALELKRFLVEYYSTGMPSSFKSEVEVTDPATGESFERTIEVNEPLRYKGVTVYQSGFDDGGSRLTLEGYPLVGASSKTFQLKGTVGESAVITAQENPASQPMTVQLTELRPINVENLTEGDPQPKAMIEHVAAVTGSAANNKNEHLKNVGPSVNYRIIDEQGQAREFVNYMMPVELDGTLVFLAGMRNSPAEPFRYVRLPADENRSLKEFMDVRAATQDPALVEQAAERFAQRNSSSPEQKDLMLAASRTSLQAFTRAGFDGIIGRVPEAERERILSFAVPMIQLTLTELRDLVRQKQGLPPLDYSQENNEANRWIQSAVLAFANLPDYPAPVMLTLDSFEQVQASVFQVARSPGMYTVYLGCLFLIIGVFSMFYIRDRRVWVWIRPHEQGSSLMAAMTSQRRNLDFNLEFDRLQEAFKRLSV
ncbi:MAG TPA: cytochrome c biogenesis protein ResB [Alcaligenes sp.]|nr:cytochrome c biogenesis protein ResB [Alcaligenes sp.]HRL26193.1 cytochrome c biogenesis protein ResB [Alcaligenes sp.]